MSDTKNNKTEERFTKPGYDARGEFTELLKGMLDMINNSLAIKDYNSSMRALFIFHSNVSGFIDPEKNKEISQKLEDLQLYYVKWETFHNRNNILIAMDLDKRFRKIFTDLIVYSKHLLLPVKDVGDTDFDAATFFGGSDL